MEDRVADTSIAPLIFGIGITLQAVTSGLVAARILTRLRSGGSLQLHDWAVLLAEIISFPQLALVISATFHGHGRYRQFVLPANIAMATRNVFIAQVIWYWSVTLAKLSIALLLLSLKHDRFWRFFLYTTMVILCGALIPITLMQLLACTPISAYWDADIRLRTQCWEPRFLIGGLIAFSSAQIFTDIVFSFMPLTFIVRLNQPLREKAVIAFLTGLGLLASATAIARTNRGLTFQGDQIRNSANISLLALVDLHVSIVAATVPCLKTFFESLVRRIVEGSKGGGSEENFRRALGEVGLLDTLSEVEGGRKVTRTSSETKT